MDARVAEIVRCPGAGTAGRRSPGNPQGFDPALCVGNPIHYRDVPGCRPAGIPMESAVARGRQGLTAPIEVSSGNRKIYRLSRRGNRRLNHVIHMAAVSQIRRRHSDGRADQKAMCVAMGGLQATPHPLGTGLLVPQHRRLRVPGRSRGHLGPGEAERLKWLWEWRRVLHGEQGIGTLARRSCDAAGVGPILESKARTPQGALEDPAFRRSARSRWHSPRRPRRTGSHWSRRTGRPVIPKIANRRPGLSRPLEAIPRWQRCWLPAICNRNRAPRSGDADAAGADGAARPGGGRGSRPDAG